MLIRNRPGWIALISVLIIGVVACGNDEASVVPPVDLPSGGLGLISSEWVSLYGDPVDDDDIFTSFAGDGFDAEYMGFAEAEPVWLFNLRFDTPVTLEEAEGIAQAYLPEDAELIQEYTHTVGLPVSVYHSDWLASSVDADVWMGAGPGDFHVMYGWSDNSQPTTMVGYVQIATGNSP